MITVKAIRAGNETPSPGDAFAESEPQRRSRAPYLLTALLSAVALYLRSAQSGAAAPTAMPADEPQQSPAQREPLIAAGDAATTFAPTQHEPEAKTAVSRPRERTEHDAWTAKASSAFPVRQIEALRDFPVLEPANTDRLPFGLPEEVNILARATPRDPVADTFGHVGVPAAVGTPPAPATRRNAPPAATRPPYMLDVGSGAFAVIAMPDLLASITDQEGDALTLLDASVSSGLLVPTEVGFLYRSAVDFVGEVELTYTVTDGQSIVTQVARLTVAPKMARGTSDDDHLVGSAYIEDLRGEEGDDEISAAGGADIIHGGPGNDRITGGDGDDRIFGEAGQDLIYGGAGNDWISGGEGDDNILGGAGDDVIAGDAGADVLSDGTGSDTVEGGDGNDAVFAAADGECDVFDGGAGTDTLDYSSAAAELVIDLVEGVAEGIGIGEDEIVGFEIVIAGAGDDHVVAGIDGVIITGGDGDDVFEFVGGEPSAELVRTIHEILDFDVGDCIIARGIELFDYEDDVENLIDLLEHGGTRGGQIPHIRLTYERFEDSDQTLIEWDNDSINDLTTVILHGHHMLAFAAPG